MRIPQRFRNLYVLENSTDHKGVFLKLDSPDWYMSEKMDLTLSFDKNFS